MSSTERTPQGAPESPPKRLPGSLIRRSAGLALIVWFLLSYDPAGTNALNDFGLPVAAALGAWLVLQNWMALALAALLLAGAHSTPGAPDLPSSVFYPLIALSSLFVVLFGIGRRFRRRIIDTRTARWSHRP